MSNKKQTPTTNEHFPRIDATPEQLAKAFLRMPPRKREEWDYVKALGGKENR